MERSLSRELVGTERADADHATALCRAALDDRRFEAEYRRGAAEQQPADYIKVILGAASAML